MRVCRECGNPRKKYSTYCEECTELHKKQAWQKANKDTWAGGNTIIEIQEFTVV